MPERITYRKTGRRHEVTECVGTTAKTLCGQVLEVEDTRPARAGDSPCGACLQVRRHMRRGGRQVVGR